MMTAGLNIKLHYEVSQKHNTAACKAALQNG